MLQISAYPLVEVDHLAPIDARVDVADGSVNRAAEVRADIPRRVNTICGPKRATLAPGLRLSAKTSPIDTTKARRGSSVVKINMAAHGSRKISPARRKPRRT
jgi:hypothetical protein